MKKNERLLSLDVLRGFDLMLLVGLQPIICAFLTQLNCEPLNNTLLYQLDHAEWEGLRVWDMVMPLFLFMSGVTMPYSLPKYKIKNGNLKVWQRVIKRFILLFTLGILVQGNILSFDFERIYLYSNTLQAIAVGYILTVPFVLYLKPKQQTIAIAILLITYSIPMYLYGDWNAQNNFACMVDKAILGRFRDGSTLLADGTVEFAGWYDYTWIWSSITFCCTVAMGSLAGQITKTGDNNRSKTAMRLLFIGVTLIICGLLAELYQPIIKRLWTASFTIYSAGWCYLLLAIFYWWIDVKNHKKGLAWLQYYGCNALTAYLIGELINFRGIAHSLLYGTAQYLNEWYQPILTLCNGIIVFFILKIMYKNKLFLKV